MKKIGVIGAGPAGAVLAAQLKKIGYDVLVVTKARRHPAWEGLSSRAVEGLRSAGFPRAVAACGKFARRYSCWHGRVELSNGEYLIEKQALECALQRDLSAMGATVLQGAARHCARRETGWQLTVFGDDGRQQVMEVDYLVSASGRTGGDNVGALSGPVSVMLSQSVSTRLGGDPFTIVEPFEDGWAWATWNGVDHASVHITVASALVSSRGCQQVFTSSYNKLDEMGKMLGVRSLAVSPVSARASRPFLKRTLADAGHLKVGDAAYTVDPLSGHGMYEAIAGAYAAAPVIHTLLERPQDADLALLFYRDRAQSLFAQRMKSGLDMYRGERRWAGNAFWAERSRDMAAPMDVQPDTADRPHFAKKPVVENGWIVEREVLLSKGHPQGIRFMDGVDLAQLYRLISTTQVTARHQLSEAFGASPQQISSAVRSLVQEGMISPSIGQACQKMPDFDDDVVKAGQV